MAKITFDSLGLNKDNFVKIALDGLSVTLNITLKSSDLKKNSKDYFTKLDYDHQHLTPPFVELFADQMGIKKETPYKDELLNSYSNNATVKAMLGYAFANQELEYSKDFETHLLKKDLFGEGNSSITIGNPNIFEVFARFILFSPFSQNSTIRNLFILLNKLDVNNGGFFVKKSHVEFLVWYIYRIGLIYMPYSEIITQCSTILNGSDCSIQSGVISSEDDPKRATVDITEILNVWLVASRRRTATSTLVLGENGQLTNLKNAISFWNNKNGGRNFKPSNQNKLEIWINSKGKTEFLQFQFDSDFKLMDKNITKNSKVLTKHVICVQNTEELLEFGQFEKILCQIDVLDWILSRLSGIGSDITQVNEAQQEIMRITTSSQFVQFTAKASFSQERSETGRVNFIAKNITSIKPPMEDVNKLDAVLDNPQAIGFGKEIPMIRDAEYLSNYTTVREIFKEAQAIIVEKLARMAAPGTQQYSYRQECLSVFKLTFEDLIEVTVNGSILKPEYYDMSLKKVSAIFKNVAAFEIAFHYRKSSLGPICNHMARYPNKPETAVEFDNPFTPCQIIAKHPQFSEVVFRGETGK